MQTFRLLYFRESVLEIAEEVRVRDLLEAIEKAAGQPPEVRVEVWLEHRRVPSSGRRRADGDESGPARGAKTGPLVCARPEIDTLPVRHRAQRFNGQVLFRFRKGS